MRRWAFVLGAAMLGGMVAAPAWGQNEAARREYLKHFNEIMPAVASFTAWQEKTGELPPDFEALARRNRLPEAFVFENGKAVVSDADWEARRAEIRGLFEEYEFGKIPPKAKLERAVVESQTAGGGIVTRTVRLEFGPQSKGVMHVTVMIPDGEGRAPVLLGPGLIGGFGGGQAQALLRRGYIAASFQANDGNDDAAGLAALYPDYDFTTLTRRAWAAQVVVDYLLTEPRVDGGKIAIFGYSRDGKMATIAAALDDRIAALVAGSTGVGGVLPWRYAGEINMAESIESTTRMFPDWFLPRLRYFSGREDRLPVDANLLVGLIAPRPVLMVYGLNDEVSNSFGNEMAYRAMAPIYERLHRAEGIGILRVPGVHGANDIEADIDWLDIQFGRSKRRWVNSFLFPFDWQTWKQRSGESDELARFVAHPAGDLAAGSMSAGSISAWEGQAAEIRKSVSWMLGEAPLLPPAPKRGAFGGRGRGATPGYTFLDVDQWIIGRTTIKEFGWLAPERDEVVSRKVSFGYNVSGDLYTPKNAPAGKKLPVVIWLHGYSYPLGYMWVYRVDLHPILALAKAGYAVLAFDQCGFGSRMSEAAPFYDRFPHWSQLGRMVEDTRAAIDALQKDPQLDGQKIYLFGYSMGGMVALHTAALDSRVGGVVAVNSFTPMRTDTLENVEAVSEFHGLAPRLGFFVDREKQIPYDYDGLMACIAPRPVYVLAPRMDRMASAGDVAAAVESARKVYSLYNAEDKLVLDQPWDYARLSGQEQKRIIEWMDGHLH